MKDWTENQYPLETLDKVPMEDKIIASREEDISIPSAEELIDLANDLLETLPEAHQVDEVFSILLDAMVATREKIIGL